jgi:UDP-N-acetylmuramate: L-alanyl-gamma-D-glutamyl-meso-diaminopimelate ligase
LDLRDCGAENFGTSFQLTPSASFILEGDEYDTAFFDKGPKFMHYFPDAVILSHVEFDHADIYRDLDAVKIAFKRLVNLVPRRGRVVAFDGSANVSECVARAFCRVERYGFAEGSDWQMRGLTHRGGKTHWQVWRGGRPWLEMMLPMAGEHNALNATAAAALAAGQGIENRAIVDALGSFKSVKRRLEVRAVERGVTVIDDFAHHPTAIRETLRALRAAYPHSRLWAVLEPRSNTLRRNVFEEELVAALALADEIVMAGVFKQESIPEAERLQPESVVHALAANGYHAVLAANVEEIVTYVAATAEPGDVVAILSNGGFDGIYEKLPARLRTQPATVPLG